MADPEVLHTNPNVPQDEDGNGAEAIFAGLNDEHAIIVQATTLVGNSETVDGLAEAIVPILPLKLDNRELYLDQSVFDAPNAALAALTARVARDETVIAANTAASATNATAIAANTAAITALQQQVAVLSQQLHDLLGSIKPSSIYPYGDANLAGAGAVLASLGHYAHIANLAGLAGAGALSADLGKVPKVLAPGNVAGAGNLAALLTATARMVAPLAGTGQLQVNALVKSLIIKQGDWAGIGVGVLTVPLAALLQARTALAGTGTATATATQTLQVAKTFAGGGTVSGTAIFPISTLDPATLPNGVTLSNGNLTATGSDPTLQHGGCARGTRAQSSGKYYFEVRFDNQLSIGGGLATMAGLANSSFSYGDMVSPGFDANSWGVGSITASNQEEFNQQIKGNLGSTPSEGDTAMVAVDFTNGRIWFGVNNAWCNGSGPSGTADYTFTPGTTLRPVVFVYKIQSTYFLVATFNPGSSAFKYTVPSGFVAWG